MGGRKEREARTRKEAGGWSNEKDALLSPVALHPPLMRSRRPGMPVSFVAESAGFVWDARRSPSSRGPEACRVSSDTGCAAGRQVRRQNGGVEDEGL